MNKGFAIFINCDDQLLSIPSSLERSFYDVYLGSVISNDTVTGLIELFQVDQKNQLSPKNLICQGKHQQGYFVRNSVSKNLLLS